jgi:DNA-binding transcriptional LysR family regulator
LSQIRYFVAVAEEGHVGRAAQRLHVSQPPLTRSIRSLEDELGTPLFQRTPRGMRLLPAGGTFLAHARRILGEVDAAIEAVARRPEERISALAAGNGASLPGSCRLPR